MSTQEGRPQGAHFAGKNTGGKAGDKRPAYEPPASRPIPPDTTAMFVAAAASRTPAGSAPAGRVTPPQTDTSAPRPGTATGTAPAGRRPAPATPAAPAAPSGRRPAPAAPSASVAPAAGENNRPAERTDSFPSFGSYSLSETGPIPVRAATASETDAWAPLRADGRAAAAAGSASTAEKSAAAPSAPASRPAARDAAPAPKAPASAPSATDSWTPLRSGTSASAGSSDLPRRRTAADAAVQATVPDVGVAPSPADTFAFTRAAFEAAGLAADAEPAPSAPASEDANTPRASRPAPAFGGSARAEASAAPAPAQAPSASAEPAAQPAVAPADDDDVLGGGDYASVGRSASLMTGLIIVSRITGFIRTWAMGLVFGTSLLSSSYSIANNLPNMLYELVMGGMLVTAFLPVYLDVRRNKGRAGAERYVGNLLGILLLVLGVLSLLATVFAPALIWTQSFMSGGEEMDTAVLFFRFFAVQVLFYGLGSVFSGVLNAHRDYFWSNFAPLLSNVVVIASFLAFPVLENVSQMLAIVVLAAGTTAGVFVQMACQIPALKKYGIRIRPHIDLRDPALRETLSLGIPTLIATLCTFVTASVQNSAALAVQPETGAAVISYARLWYTLPYSLLAVSITTALYTELARDAACGDDDAVRAGISSGVGQMFFYLVPFMLYLIVFATPLNMVYCAGRFTLDGVALVSEYLVFLATALPFYGIFVLMQKACSALMDMKPYVVSCVLGAAAQVAVALCGGVWAGWGMPAIALSTTAFYVVSCAGTLVWMRGRLHGLQLRGMFHGLAFGAVLGVLGAAAGAGVLTALETFAGPLVVNGASVSMLKVLLYVVVAGLVSLVVTFGPAVALKLPEAGMISSIVGRFTGRR